MSKIIELSAIHKSFSKQQVLNNINLSVNRGEIFGLIGRNGAGKSTIIKIICGMVFPDKGSISLLDQADLSKARRHISSIIDEPAYFPYMTGLENLIAQSKLLNLKKSKEELIELLNTVGLEFNKKKVKTYSLGMRQRLALAIALLGDPKVIILDEPMNGLDPVGIIEMRELILKINQEKQVTFIISSHILSELEKLATRFIIIDEGSVIKEASYEDIEEQIEYNLNMKFDEENYNKALEFCKAKNLNVKLNPNQKQIQVLGLKDSSSLIKELSEAGIATLEFNSNKQGLESFFINSLKEKQHA